MQYVGRTLLVGTKDSTCHVVDQTPDGVQDPLGSRLNWLYVDNLTELYS